MKKVMVIFAISLAVIAFAAFIFVTVRQVLALRAIESEWQSQPDIAPELATTSRLEIIPLYEAESGSNGLISGHGVSYLIRTDSATLLLDVGNNPDGLSTAPFMQNMETLGIQWEEVSRIVISHPHGDHVGGTKAWWNRTVALGDLAFPESLGERLIFVPAPVAFKKAIHATIPTLPAPDVATTGVISYPEIFPLSIFTPRGAEQALVVHVAGEGLILITGCGHPGLERLVQRAESLYGEEVVGVVGGLHYVKETVEEVQPHIQFLQSRPLRLVALSPHDSNEAVRAAFENAFPDAYQRIAVGEAIRLPRTALSKR